MWKEVHENLNETKHLLDEYEDQENFYLLTNFNAVTMETTVINMVQSLICQSLWEPQRERVSNWELYLNRKLIYSKCVEFADNLVIFTHVGSVKGRPTIAGDTGYLKFGSVSSVVMLFGPGIDDRVKWQWALNGARISSSHLNICWRQTRSCSLVRCLKHKTSGHLNAFDDNLFKWTAFNMQYAFSLCGTSSFSGEPKACEHCLVNYCSFS